MLKRTCSSYAGFIFTEITKPSRDAGKTMSSSMVAPLILTKVTALAFTRDSII